MSGVSSVEGLSTARLARLTGVLRGYVDRGDAPGIVALVTRGGRQVHCDVLGAADDEGAPLFANSLFRIGSMSKPVASVAALILMEEGLIRLSDPIDKFLPEFSSLKVLKEIQGPIDETYLSPRAITVEDLLTHRSGLAGGNVSLGPIGKAAQVLNGGISKRADMDPDTWLATLAALPLQHPPGERTVQGFSYDVLGILIERATGESLDDFLRERIFQPLRMADTCFWVPPEKQSRLVTAYGTRWPSGRRVATDRPDSSSWLSRPKLLSAGGGLLSTAEDYARFGRMLLDGGILDGERVLSRKSVELLTTDFLTPEQRKIPFFGFDYWEDRGFGLGVYVIDDMAKHRGLGSVGQYGWRGAYGTFWFNDPVERLTAVMMVQVNWPMVLPPILQDFETMVYQAIAD